MAIVEKVELVKKEQIKSDIYKYSIKSDKMACDAKPGQFLEIRVTDSIEPFLRRPISIHNVKKEEGIIEFIFQVKGKGTELLSERKEGELIDIIGPLGQGTFNIDGYEKIAIIGGGIGIFPLYELAKKAKKDGKNVNMYLGFRNRDFVILENEYKNVSNNFTLSTDDGSYGKNGFAINFLKDDISKNPVDCIYACGPLPMLKAVQALAKEKNIPCQLSLEERMGCGMGACIGCVVKYKTETEDTFKRVCREGPVFDANTVEI